MTQWKIEPLADVASVVIGDASWAPVVLDSPHSGRNYPRDFQYAAPLAVLRRGEDTFVDELFDPQGSGAVLIAAQFPRTYIDPNRPADDLDIAMLADAWPGAANPGPKTALGKGLIWRSCLGEVAVYDRLLGVAEVRDRIERYWVPYRNLLAETLDWTHAQAGGVWHIDCHSMPSFWPEGMQGAGTAVETDFLLGDRDGTTCAPGFTTVVREFLQDQGFTVAVNDRFKGVDIVARSGDPSGNRHSLQIEVVRERYMDEQRFEHNEGYARVRRCLQGLVQMLCENCGDW